MEFLKIIDNTFFHKIWLEKISKIFFLHRALFNQ